ncbi:MAG: hypothetical protein JWR61_5508 [Ferruginibacter sp.]|uniref:hypothetical protein n=1 Tax=Ferruginibacter sp. TaxID=1940288 RepID=UPI00265A588D|nr:hypothetical protein [Ferruginibacter sp.]MDB5280553.1 hypothetical protein [Ferruginibacter sp.]
MKPDNDILFELQSLSPLLARLPKANVLSVPDGYFDTLGDTILVCLNEQAGTNSPIQQNDVPAGYFDNLSSSILDKLKAVSQHDNTEAGEEGVAIPSLWKNKQPGNLSEIPQGYFDNLSSLILDKLKTTSPENSLEELEKISPLLLTAKNANVFELPVGYFENLSSAMLSKVKALPESAGNELETVSPLLLSLKHLSIFETPAGYFDNLSSGILNTVKALEESPASELKKISPLLLNIQHVNVFDVPAGYFNTVSDNVFNVVQPVKVVPMRDTRVIGMPKVRALFRYAAAAAITGAIALGVYKSVNQPMIPKTESTPTSFAKLDPAIEKGKSMNEEEFNAELNNLTKDDITSYLEKNGSEEDVSLLTSSPDAIDLPNQDDYLLDDKTLDNYLDKINFKN